MHPVNAGGTVAIQVALGVQNVISLANTQLLAAFQDLYLAVFHGQDSLPGTLGQEKLLLTVTVQVEKPVLPNALIFSQVPKQFGNRGINIVFSYDTAGRIVRQWELRDGGQRQGNPGMRADGLMELFLRNGNFDMLPGHIRNGYPGGVLVMIVIGIVKDTVCPGVFSIFHLGKVIGHLPFRCGRDIGKHIVFTQIHIGIGRKILSHAYDVTEGFLYHTGKAIDWSHQVLCAVLPLVVDRYDVPIFAYNQFLYAVPVQILEAETQL